MVVIYIENEDLSIRECYPRTCSDLIPVVETITMKVTHNGFIPETEDDEIELYNEKTGKSETYEVEIESDNTNWQTELAEVVCQRYPDAIVLLHRAP